MTPACGPFSLDRAVAAVERVRDRLLRTTGVLRDARVPYAIVGGHAVALWVSRVDAAAVRNTQDADLLLRRSDFEAAKAALEAGGFVHEQVAGVDLFLDGPNAGPRDAVHVVFANEKVRPHEPEASPDVDESVEAPDLRVINLDALVRMMLTAFDDKDRTQLRDLIDIGLVTADMLPRLPTQLAQRLRALLETPDG